MRTTWIVQTNGEPPTPTADRLRRACEAEDQPFLPIAVPRGATALPELPDVAGPVVLHGRTSLILAANADPRWRRGVFLDPERFTQRAWQAAWGPRLLNAGARVARWSELLGSTSDEAVFVRPPGDSKLFTGHVRRLRECGTLYADLVAAGRPLGPADEVVLAPPCEIDGEWRLFVVDGEVVTGSAYRPSADPRLPPGLVAFAEEAVATWAPAAVLALDVARADGEWRIVECNCFNWSGVYAADAERLVRAVSDHQEGAR